MTQFWFLRFIARAWIAFQMLPGRLTHLNFFYFCFSYFLIFSLVLHTRELSWWCHKTPSKWPALWCAPTSSIFSSCSEPFAEKTCVTSQVQFVTLKFLWAQMGIDLFTFFVTLPLYDLKPLVSVLARAGVPNLGCMYAQGHIYCTAAAK